MTPCQEIPRRLQQAKKEEVERLKADLDAKRAVLEQIDLGPDHMEAWGAWYEAETAYKEALAELAVLTGSAATVTQSFQIPTAYVNSTNVKWVTVHQCATGNEYGAITLFADGKTGTAVHNATSFSPFIVYAFVEQPQQESKVIGSLFADVSTDAWYYDAVKYAYDNGLMTGTSTTERIFSPEGITTRAQIVTIQHRLEGAPGVDYLLRFSDVAEEQWYTEAVRWAAACGITSGTGDGTTFSPDAPIIREQLAAFLYRFAQYKGYDVSVGVDTNILSYEDAFTVSEYAYPALQWTCGAGVMGGMNCASGGMLLDPQGSATRAQAATMLMRFCERGHSRITDRAGRLSCRPCFRCQ